MRKRKKGRKFGRKRDQRKALLKGLASNLFLKERIKTTEARAKEATALISSSITKAKKGNLHSKRLLLRFFSPKIAKKLMENIGPRYKERQGGYTRIIKLGAQKIRWGQDGDN